MCRAYDWDCARRRRGGRRSTFTAEAWGPLSGFAAGLLKAALGVGAFWLFDRFVLPGDAATEILGRRNVAYGLLLVALSMLLAATIATASGIPDHRPVAWADSAPSRIARLPAAEGGGVRPA